MHAMYELTVERTFSAAHAIVINGRREPVHGHNWRVRLTVSGAKLDSHGLLCDFHVLERIVDGVIRAWDNNDLNRVPPFDKINPTAEAVAKTIFDLIRPQLPASIRLQRVRVTEAPGCEAAWVAE